MPLRVGQSAPDFTVTSSTGETLALQDFRGKKNVVLYFYPADFTAVCTKETCGFKDAYAELAGADTEIIGVSVDSDDSHKRFASAHGVEFPLVSDPSKALAERYEATDFLFNLLGRTRRITYVIDKRGSIAGVFIGALGAQRHVQGARDLVRKLQASEPRP